MTTDDTFEAIVSRHLDALLEANSPGPTSNLFPSHVHVEPTNACNLRCIHCAQDHMRRKRGLMAWNTYSRIIDEVGPRKASISLNVQGEPLLHPRIVDMVALAAKHGCHVSLLTNAALLNEDKSRQLLDAGLSRIVFSFDAVERRLYEAIRRRGNYRKTLRNILRFLDINLSAGRPVFVCMSIIRQQATREHIQAYKDYFASLPVDTIFVSELLNMSGFSQVAPEVDMSQARSRPRDQWPICRTPWENITVNWDGSVCPCPLDFDVRCNAGNIQHQTLAEMWNGEAYQAFRRAHLNRNYEAFEAKGPLCSTCSCLWDPEYDLRQYRRFVVKSITRKARQHARLLIAEEADVPVDDPEVLKARLAARIQELDRQE